MKIYQCSEKHLLTIDSLLEALQIPVCSGLVISLVGAGGKTSVLYQLAKEISLRVKKVIVTTSTHIKEPESHIFKGIEKASELDHYKYESGILVVGTQTANRKLKGLPKEELVKLLNYADVLLIEADGAKGLPLKIPAEHEPVIIPETQYVIACAGLDSIGKTVEETAFRKEQFFNYLKLREDNVITPKEVSEILSAPWGSKKGVGSLEYRIVLNKGDNEEQCKKGMEVISSLPDTIRKYAIITSFLSS